MKRFALVALIALTPLVAIADPATTPEESIPKPNCEQPALPSDAPADPEASRIKHKDSSADFQKNFDAWRVCMKAYIDGQGEASKRHIAAANAAVKEVNDYISQVNAAAGK